MMTARIPRFMIVGTGSGCGKTTLTCGILKALQNRGLRLSSFKCGPDYIDPMFHSKVIGTKSRNLDLYLCNEATVKYLFAENSAAADFSVIEGVMGLYDGLGDTDECSANHLSLVTDTPEILVVNTKGLSLSIAAQIYGYLHFKKNNIQGILLNHASEGMYPFYKNIIEDTLHLPVYGHLPDTPEAVFHSRHLGLITAEEVQDLQEKLEVLAEACEKNMDLDGMIALGNRQSSFSYHDISVEPIIPIPVRKPENEAEAPHGSNGLSTKFDGIEDGIGAHSPHPVRIAVARDKAFCFYYEDNFALLERLGAQIIYFSPLDDPCVPQNADGLILGGGYPEEYAAALAENTSMRKSVKTAIQGGLPVIAECGGFMYLFEQLTDRQDRSFPMAGVFKGVAGMTDKLSRFGYAELTANRDNLLCRQGDRIRAHEFHYSDSGSNGTDFTARKRNGKEWNCIHANETMFAGYPHLHLWGNIEFAKKFIKKCIKCEETEQ